MFWNKKKEDRGKAIIYIEDCVACGACVQRCRRDAIGFVEIHNEKYARLIYPEQCTGCGNCVKVCDYGAIEIVNVSLCRI
ncbi:4Fe-4S dicluster domain-containing protein [Bacteroidales bacterium OttesenSCG-928-A17]|nr:4Fe-4S dicluster domain-containing protein [Bacteroidales bacterium OttesenSCG-928-A17]